MLLVLLMGWGFVGNFFTHNFNFEVLVARAEDSESEEKDEEIEELEEKIEEYEKKIAKLKDEEASLQREIDYAESQIGLTETRIQSVEYEIQEKEIQIDELSGEIENLGGRISKLLESIYTQEELLLRRVRARYKSFRVSPVVIIFGSDNLSEAVQKSEYLRLAERQDRELMGQMNSTKNLYDQQKFLTEVKRDEVEELKRQVEIEKQNLENYKADLDRQKKDKEKLLEETENDEQKFQALLAQVQSELAAKLFALDLPYGEGVEVKEGDVIGFMGNTGCSTGPHLHFGYIRNGSTVDPLPYLENGELEWPVDNWEITQYFGENYTFYMNNFGIPGHDAIDIISTIQWSGAPIRAARDGEVYYAQDSKVYCPWINNSLGKGAIIDHGDDDKTIYWHLQ